MKKIKASELELKETVVSISRVTKVVKGGRRFSFSAIVVVGNEKGVVGYGLGKANEVTNAIIKGTDDAKKNLIITISLAECKSRVPAKQNYFCIEHLILVYITITTLRSHIFTNKIPILKNTVPHEVTGKYGGGLVLIKPAAPGTGVIAGGAMRSVFENAGIKDVLAKSKGSSNPHNVIKATFGGLLKLRDPLAVSKQRGVSLNKIFHG